MPAQWKLNQHLTPTTNSYVLWFLSRQLLAAGWQLFGNGNNSSFAVSTVGSPITVGSGNDKLITHPGDMWWCVLYNPTYGTELCLWQRATWTGKIISAKGQGFTSAAYPSASNSSPGTIPAGVGYVRGSAGADVDTIPGTGGLYAHISTHIYVADIAQGGDWYLFSGNATNNSSYGRWGRYIAFSGFDPYVTGQTWTNDGFVFWTINPTSNNSWTGSITNLDLFGNNGTVGTTATPWMGFRRDGSFGYLGGQCPSSYLGSGYPVATADNRIAPKKFYLDRVQIYSSITGVREVRGLVKLFRVTSLAHGEGATFGSLTWRRIGVGGSAAPMQGLVIPWDGVTTSFMNS